MKASEVYLAAAEIVEESYYGACYAISVAHRGVTPFPVRSAMAKANIKHFEEVFDHSRGEFAYFMGPTRWHTGDPLEAEVIEEAYQRRVYALLLMAEIAKDEECDSQV